MQIDFLKNNDINEFSRLARIIILNTPYYSSLAKKHEIKKYSTRNLRLKLHDRKNLYILAKNENKIVGFCNGYFDAGIFWIDWVGVHISFRGKELSVKLLNFLEKTLKKSNVHKIWCDCLTTNKQSISLLKKLKFKKFALLKKHWYKQDFYLWYKFI